MKGWLIGLPALMAAACSQPSPLTLDDNVASSGTSPSEGAEARTTPLPTGRRDARPAAPATATATDADGPIPIPIRGKWRQTEASTVTAAECRDYDAPNMGKILVIGADRFNVFEEGGRLLAVQRRDASRIRATFDTTYADTPTRADYDFDAREDGQILIVRIYGTGAPSGPIRYLRCPT